MEGPMQLGTEDTVDDDGEVMYKERSQEGVDKKARERVLVKSILIKLRTRPARTTFRWVKGHPDNYGNNQADTLANEGRISILEDNEVEGAVVKWYEGLL
jgi:ribonuclease HI